MRTQFIEFTFLCWNVEGLITKLSFPDFLPYVEQFSFVCLTETFVEYIPDNIFLNFEHFISPAKRLSKLGRRSGGVLCLIKKEYGRYFEQVHCRYDNVIVFKISKILLATSCDNLLFCVYIPPVDSPYYNTVEEPDGVTILEKCITEIGAQHNNCNIILCGDFNCRTGTYNTANVWNAYDVRSEAIVDTRNSQDKEINVYGRSLLTLCISFELSILNGCEDIYGSAQFTFMSHSGKSVIDYFIASRSIIHLFTRLDIKDSVLSSHSPLEMTVACNITMSKEDKMNMLESKLIWDESMAERYRHTLQETLDSTLCVLMSTERRQQVNIDIDLDIDDVTSELTKCLLESGKCMEKTFIRGNISHKKLPWFDRECYDVRRRVRRLLRMYKKTLLEEDKKLYFECRKAYKSLVRTKRVNYQRSTLTALYSHVHDPQMFWSYIRRLSSRYPTTPNISREDWFNYFKKIFHDDASVGTLMLQTDVETEPNLDQAERIALNAEITIGEIERAINHLKLHKAPGSDKIIAEMLKCSVSFLMPYLYTLFNAIFDSGSFPCLWQESIIVPIHKKGNRDDPNNYRGISLTSTLSKVFLHVLNCRLQEWTEEYGLIGEEQAGFRRGYSTIDNVFILHGIVERYLGRKKKLYAAFIDFHKAFDSVSREALFVTLRRSGISGKMFRILKSMYCSVRSYVKCPCGNTDYFECTSGLKQGCKCSPILFSYVVEEIAKEVIRKGKHGIQLFPDMTTVYLLLFADDIVLFADTPIGLQNQLDNLKTSAESVGLSINRTKSKVMVFRLGGHLAAHERWHLGGEKIEVVNEYTYLGYKLSTKLCSNTTLTNLSTKGKAAVVRTMRPMKRLMCTSPTVIFKIFDAQIQSILLYGSEIWGVNNCDEIERVHLYTLKDFLNVSFRTPNLMVYGDTGRYPLYIGATLRCVKYWLRLTSMDNERYPKKVYQMMIQTNNSNDCWANKIRTILCEYDFEDVWNQQGVESVNEFLKELKYRLIRRYIEGWLAALCRSERYSFFKLFKNSHGIEQYLFDLNKIVFRNPYIQFRFGTSELYVHRYRYNDSTTYLCPSCTESDEDEIHFLFNCPAYEDIRTKYLHFCIGLSVQEGLLMCFMNYDAEICKSVSSYLYQAFKRRRSVLNL